MYSIKYKGDDGKEVLFDANAGIVCDMNVGDGMSVNLSTSQGFSQVGETVQSRSVGGKIIDVKGTIFRDVQNVKRKMINSLTPFSSGTLFFEGTHKIRVVVKTSPSFSPVKNNGKFSMQFFAPFPFFYSVEGKTEVLGKIVPLFSFPVNYGTTHTFGRRERSTYMLLENEGDVKVPYSVVLECTGASTNPTITNLHTFEFLKLNGSLEDGDVVTISRNKDEILTATLTRDGQGLDIISWIDENSTFFELNVGDNMVSINDDEGGTGLLGRISYNPAVVAVYES